MLPLVLMVPLVLVSLDLVVPWPSASGAGVLPVLVSADWASEAARPRRLSGELPLEGSVVLTDEERGSLFAWLAIAGLALFWLGIALCVAQLVFACRYVAKVTDRRPPLRDGDGASEVSSSGDFATGPLNCYDDAETCLHACFCSQCRAGDTYQAAGVERYWTVIGLLLLAAIVGNMVGELIAFIIPYDELKPSDAHQFKLHIAVTKYMVTAWITGLIFHTYRRKLRAKLGGSEEKQPNRCSDIAMFGFCTCCAIAQEARAIDAATGVKVECCCQLTNLAGEPIADQPKPIVGQPV